MQLKTRGHPACQSSVPFAPRAPPTLQQVHVFLRHSFKRNLQRSSSAWAPIAVRTPDTALQRFERRQYVCAAPCGLAKQIKAPAGSGKRCRIQRLGFDFARGIDGVFYALEVVHRAGNLRVRRQWAGRDKDIVAICTENVTRIRIHKYLELPRW